MAISTRTSISERVTQFIYEMCHVCFVTALIDESGTKHLSCIHGTFFSITRKYNSFVSRLIGAVHLQPCITIAASDQNVTVSDGNSLIISDAYRRNIIDNFVDTITSSRTLSAVHAARINKEHVVIICDTPTFGSSMKLSCLARYERLISSALNDMIGIPQNGAPSSPLISNSNILQFEFQSIDVVCNFIENLDGLPAVTNDCSISINSNSITSLTGLPNQLTSLSLNDCDKLESLDGLSEVISRSLAIYDCPRLSDFGPLRKCKIAGGAFAGTPSRPAPNIYLNMTFADTSAGMAAVGAIRNVSAIIRALEPGATVLIRMSTMGDRAGDVYFMSLSKKLSELLTAKAGGGRVAIMSLLRELSELGYGAII